MNLMLLAPIGAVISLLFALFLTHRIRGYSTGTERMTQLSAAIKRSAQVYLKRQYLGVSIFFSIMFAVLITLRYLGLVNPFVPYAFITGGFFSALSGFIGMSIATSSNARTAFAASESLNKGLRVAFSAGGVMGFTVVGLGLLDMSFWYFLLTYAFHLDVQAVASAMLTFGMGASCMALFARVGGGIFTKAADVGADLVGKVEAGIPEDDPRNPAVIADNVGDNVGDVAGMGADLYESYVGSIVSSTALAVAAGLGVRGVMIPMVMAAIGIVASIVGTFFVRSGEQLDQKALLAALRKGIYVSSTIIVVVAFALVWFVLGKEHIGIFFAIVTGLTSGILIGQFTEYNTSDSYIPTQRVASAATTGPATVIISGIALGMKSTLVPILIIGTSVLTSFYVAGGSTSFNLGLFGIGLSAVGMLSTLGITLATDAYGPVADNAGGIAQMSNMDPEVRRRTDALDSLGNTTAATGKGFAIGSAALTSLALLASFMHEVQLNNPSYSITLDIMNPATLTGLFIGGALPFLFSSMTMSAVGRAAQSVVIEVRRQFREITGIMEHKVEPNYASCVDICTKSAQREMVLPALTAIAFPIVTGLLLGPYAVAALLAGATVSGFVLAIMMSNAGGTWDNAKKYIESGNHLGKGSDAHKAAIVGDTVGDPFKDTAGPSINILIKLLSMVAIVFASIFSHGCLLGFLCR